MANYLIIEDDKVQRENLVKIIKEIKVNCNIFESDNMDDSLKIADLNKIDIVFIDIHLKKSNGIEFAKKFRKIQGYELTWIIFITTHKDYMMQAFKQIHCYDYILKPIKKETIESIITTLNGSKNFNDNHEKDYVVFNKKDMIIKICVEDIIFIEVNVRICTVHAKTGVYLVNRISLKSILNKINKDYIIKTHRSYAVNAYEVDKIIRAYRGCWQLSFKGYNQQALLTDAYKEKLMEKMGVN